MAAGARASRAAARRNPCGLVASRPGGGWSGLLGVVHRNRATSLTASADCSYGRPTGVHVTLTLTLTQGWSP
jgi:hypothetical protein